MHETRAVPALDAPGVARALAQLHALVAERGLKASSVRDAIARAALAERGHFTADELAQRIRVARGRRPHVATVYRVLPLLVDAGLLQQSLMATGETGRYERAFEREHHDHLLCTVCRRVVEFHFEAIEAMQRDVAERFGFELSGHVHELFGTCRDCRARARSRRS